MQGGSVQKEHLEFHAIDLSNGWEVPEGYPRGIEQKILSGHLDERAGIGARTRLLRFQPGAFTTSEFVHDYWEEVYLLSGDLHVGDSKECRAFSSHTYACRPPAVPHGPFKSVTGCLLLEIHFYARPN